MNAPTYHGIETMKKPKMNLFMKQQATKSV
jgi:hypothetical protein